MAPPVNAIAAYRQSRNDAGGVAPISRSRIIPPASAVANASTITPSRSRLPPIAAVAPSIANSSVPAISTANSSLLSLLLSTLSPARTLEIPGQTTTNPALPQPHVRRRTSPPAIEGQRTAPLGLSVAKHPLRRRVGRWQGAML